MSLYPGEPRKVGDKFVLDATALNDSMAQAIEAAMAAVYQELKGTPLPDSGKDDRLMLWVAISRGILTYLVAHQNDMVGTVQLTNTAPGSPAVTFNVNAVGLNTTGLT